MISAAVYFHKHGHDMNITKKVIKNREEMMNAAKIQISDVQTHFLSPTHQIPKELLEIIILQNKNIIPGDSVTGVCLIKEQQLVQIFGYHELILKIKLTGYVHIFNRGQVIHKIEINKGEVLVNMSEINTTNFYLNEEGEFQIPFTFKIPDTIPPPFIMDGSFKIICSYYIYAKIRYNNKNFYQSVALNINPKPNQDHILYQQLIAEKGMAQKGLFFKTNIKWVINMQQDVYHIPSMIVGNFQLLQCQQPIEFSVQFYCLLYFKSLDQSFEFHISQQTFKVNNPGITNFGFPVNLGSTPTWSDELFDFKYYVRGMFESGCWSKISIKNSMKRQIKLIDKSSKQFKKQEIMQPISHPSQQENLL